MFLLCNLVLMSSKALPPFRKNSRYTWWRFYIPVRNFTAQSLRSVCFPHTSWQSHISIQPVIQFSRCCDQSLHQTSKTKENMHSLRGNILIYFFVYRCWLLSPLYIGLLKKYWKINPLAIKISWWVTLSLCWNKKTPHEKQNRFLRSIFHTVPGISLLLFYAF